MYVCMYMYVWCTLKNQINKSERNKCMLYTYTCAQKITKWFIQRKRSFMGGISRSNLSNSLNDTSLIKNDRPVPPLSCLFVSAFAPEVSESLPVSFCTTDLKLVASVSTYWVLIMTTFTGPLLHPPVAIVEKDEFFPCEKLKGLSRVSLEQKGLNRM
ncbi:hypothetical protein V8G54_026999 [Vigna mungo]|uniref:Uncharacterized protein n=1 Tax=Vigna mungo TaxID=3915 RepID=A0AAQ3MZR9_VIGMU